MPGCKTSNIQRLVTDATDVKVSLRTVLNIKYLHKITNVKFTIAKNVSNHHPVKCLLFNVLLDTSTLAVYILSEKAIMCKVLPSSGYSDRKT